MKEFLIDWLTLTFKPCNNCTVDCESVEAFLFDFFRIDRSTQRCFTRCGGGVFYDYGLRYNGLCFKFPYEDDVINQGFCIEFSGQAISWYESYIKKQYKAFTWKELLIDFFALGVEGYTCKCTRIDIAFDDKVYNDETKPLLDIKKIYKAAERCEYISMLRVWEPILNVEKRENYKKSKNSCEKMGETIYFGNRKSKVFCRFYDKLKEQFCKGVELPDGLTHWVRMEFEFKDLRAMSLIDCFVQLSEKDFAKYLSQVINKYICFVAVRNACRSNLERAPQKRWWARFVGTFQKTKLACNKADKNVYNHSMQYLRRSVMPLLHSILHCITIDEFLTEVFEEGNKRPYKKHDELIEDYTTPHIDANYNNINVHKLTSDEYKKLLEKYKTASETTRNKRLISKLDNCFDYGSNTTYTDRFNVIEYNTVNTATYNQQLDMFKPLSFQNFEESKAFAEMVGLI